MPPADEDGGTTPPGRVSSDIARCGAAGRTAPTSGGILAPRAAGGVAGGAERRAGGAGRRRGVRLDRRPAYGQAAAHRTRPGRRTGGAEPTARGHAAGRPGRAADTTHRAYAGGAGRCARQGPESDAASLAPAVNRAVPPPVDLSTGPGRGDATSGSSPGRRGHPQPARRPRAAAAPRSAAGARRPRRRTTVGTHRPPGRG